MPAPANVPGQIGWGQLLDMVKVQPSEILNRRANIGTKANTLEVADASMGGEGSNGLALCGEEGKGEAVGGGWKKF